MAKDDVIEFEGLEYQVHQKPRKSDCRCQNIL